MITRFRVEKYKALREVDLALTPIHVLIGPNNSGKSSLLQALAAVAWSTERELKDCFGWSWVGAELVWGHDRQSHVTLEAVVDPGCQYRISLSFQGKADDRTVQCVEERWRHNHETPSWRTNKTRTIVSLGAEDVRRDDQARQFLELYELLSRGLQGAQLYRWNPDYLAQPAALKVDRPFWLHPTGFGLPICLGDLALKNRDRFLALERDLRQCFPEVESLVLDTVKGHGMARDFRGADYSTGPSEGLDIAIRMKGASVPIPARQLSQGLLATLGYLAVLYQPEPPSLLLVEEPETGIHPSLLKQVVRNLRRLIDGQSRTQVVLSTHSPYLLDEFQPEEVSLCSRLPDGSTALQRLCDSARVRRQIDVFSLGEIWGQGEDNLTRAEPDGCEAVAGQ